MQPVQYQLMLKAGLIVAHRLVWFVRVEVMTIDYYGYVLGASTFVSRFDLDARSLVAFVKYNRLSPYQALLDYRRP
ncbi:hypothetical protein D3C71_1582750 [compost metagenome]